MYKMVIRIRLIVLLAFLILLVYGCAVFPGMVAQYGEPGCKQWSTRIAYRQVCTRFSGGVCMNYTTESYWQDYCVSWKTKEEVERERGRSSAIVSSSNVDSIEAYDELAKAVKYSDKLWGGVLISESELRKLCNSDNPDDTAFCYGYVSGLYDHFWYYGKFYDGTLACPPKSLTPQQIQDTVTLYLQKHPLSENADATAAMAILSALGDKWPCGKGVNTGTMVKDDIFRSWCGGSTIGGKSKCKGTRAGIFDASSIVFLTNSEYFELDDCFSQNLTVEQIYKVVAQYLHDHPSFEYGGPGNMVKRAISSKYKCKWKERRY